MKNAESTDKKYSFICQSTCNSYLIIADLIAAESELTHSKHWLFFIIFTPGYSPVNPLFNIEVHQSSGDQKLIVEGSISKDFLKSEWFNYSKEIQSESSEI